MLIRNFLLLWLIWGISFCAIAQPTRTTTIKTKWLDTEGLYYLDTKQNQNDVWALVITRNGRSIPPKENDPSAPTKLGFYIGNQHYQFRTYTVTRATVFFQTAIVAGRSFRFRGTVRRLTICGFKNIPELRGRLVEINGSTRKQKNVRFGHAVVC